MNYSNVTVQDCIDNHEKKDLGVVLHNGKVEGFQDAEGGWRTPESR